MSEDIFGQKVPLGRSSDEHGGSEDILRWA